MEADESGFIVNRGWMKVLRLSMVVNAQNGIYIFMESLTGQWES